MMTDTKQSRIVHVLPSLTDVAFLMPVIFMFTKLGGAKALLGDGDTGWHIRTGEWILANHQVPRSDIFSFTKPGQPWFAWEWGTDVIFAVLHQHWGLAGVVMFGMLLLGLMAALLFKLVSRHCENPFLAITCTYLAIATTSVHWHARPHLFTLLFVVVFLHVLDRVQEQRRWKLLWLLPAITLLWTNLHGGFFVGIFIIGCYGLGEALTWILSPDRAGARSNLTAALRYWAIAAGCLLISLANPYTYHLHVFIVSYLRAPFLDRITEFMAPNFRAGGAINFELLLFASAGFLLWNIGRRRYAQALNIIAWFHLSLFAARNAPIFGLVVAPIVARSLEEVLAAISDAPVSKIVLRPVQKFQGAARDFAVLDGPWRVHALSAVFAVFLGTAMLRLPLPVTTAKFDQKLFPVRALTAIEATGSRNVLTTDQWGDFLIYSMYPSVRVYFDGRSDFYGNDFVEEYIKLMAGAPNWEQTVATHSVNTILLPVESPLSAVIKSSRQWTVAYDDGHAIVFDKRDAAKMSTAEKRMEDRDRRITDSDGRDPKITANTNRDLRITQPKPL